MRCALILAGLLVAAATPGRAAAPVAPGGYSVELVEEHLLISVDGSSIVLFSACMVSTDATHVALLYPVPAGSEAEVVALDAADRIRALADPTRVRREVRPGSLLSLWRRHRARPQLPPGTVLSVPGGPFVPRPSQDAIRVVPLPVDGGSPELSTLPPWLAEQLSLLCSGEQPWLTKEPQPAALVVVWCELDGHRGHARTFQMAPVRISFTCDQPLVPFRAPQTEDADAARTDRPFRLAALTSQPVRPVYPGGYPPFPDSARTCSYRPAVAALRAMVEGQLGPGCDVTDGPVLSYFTANVPVTARTDDLLLEATAGGDVVPQPREQVDVGIVPVDLLVLLAVLLGVLSRRRRGRGSSSSASVPDPPSPEG